MGRRVKKTKTKPDPHFYTASLRRFSELLFLIGQPLFLLFSYLFLAIISLVYITGYTFRKLSGRIFIEFSKLKLRFKKIAKRTTIQASRIPRRKLSRHGVIFDSKAKKIRVKRKLKPITRFSAKIIFFVLNTVLKILSDFYRIVFSVIKSIVGMIEILKLKVRLYTISKKEYFKKAPTLRVSKLKILSYFFVFSIFILTTASVLFWYFILKDLPSPKTLTQRQIPLSTKIYDRNGVLLYTIFKDQKRTLVSLEDIPLSVRLATIAVEDAEFYTHPGFSIKGIVRAISKNIKSRQLTGGSTITQQLVKNALLSPEKTIIRKLKEISLAVQVELTFNKDEILEMYLNEVSYGGIAYGIQEAARTYFDKDIGKLNLAEAALLAGLPKSPTAYSPFGSNPDLARNRQNEVLSLMRVNGFITKDQELEAKNEELKFTKNKTPILAPHFVFYVREVLDEIFGKEMVHSGGLEVVTTLDFEIQKLVEKIIKEEVEKLKELNVTNAAAIVINPKTGEILAMVGSKDYFDTDSDGNVNVVLKPRQPGSSIKVINYANALTKGLTAATIINDSPVTFNVEGQPPYSPKNYEGGFRGSLTLRNALAESRNIPAVKTLAVYGIEPMIELGRKMGITTWENIENYGLSLTLGGGEVKLIDLAYVYSILANQGKKPNNASILKVTDYRGNILKENKCHGNQVESFDIAQVKQIQQADQVEKDIQINKLTNQQIDSVNASTQSALSIADIDGPSCSGEQILDPRVAFIITNILHDNQARTPSFGSNSLLVIPNHKEVAVKTGTSNNLRDNLTIGYNQDYVVAVWVGNNDNSPMSRIASGVTGATPIWNKIMTLLLSENQNPPAAAFAKAGHDWSIPDGLIQLPICPYTGTLACQGCPVRLEWFLEENIPKLACNPEWFDKTNESDSEEEKPEEAETVQQITAPNSGWTIDNILDLRFGKQKKKPKRN